MERRAIEYVKRALNTHVRWYIRSVTFLIQYTTLHSLRTLRHIKDQIRLYEAAIFATLLPSPRLPYRFEMFRLLVG